MFWNDPNLYSVAFKDIPNIPNFPTPFLGQFPRFTTPYAQYPFMPYLQAHQRFRPPLPPTFFNAQCPGYFPPPVTPFFQAPTPTPFVNPLLNPMLGHYGYNLPFFQGYRPLGI